MRRPPAGSPQGAFAGSPQRPRNARRPFAQCAPPLRYCFAFCRAGRRRSVTAAAAPGTVRPRAARAPRFGPRAGPASEAKRAGVAGRRQLGRRPQLRRRASRRRSAARHRASAVLPPGHCGSAGDRHPPRHTAHAARAAANLQPRVLARAAHMHMRPATSSADRPSPPSSACPPSPPTHGERPRPRRRSLRQRAGRTHD